MLFRSKISEDFVWLALDQFKKDKLIAAEYQSVFQGMSRREVIRKVGFASMVALPIVASMIAPTSANAASTCVCVAPGDCLAQVGCPNTMNCNGAMTCAP